MAIDLATGASDTSSMTLRVLRLPFSIDPLIAEARRRARQRRLLFVLSLVALAGVAAFVTFALRPAPHVLTAVAGPHGGYAQISGMTLIAFDRASPNCSPPERAKSGLSVVPFYPLYCIHLVPPEAGGLDQVWELTAAVKLLGRSGAPILPQDLRRVGLTVRGPTTVFFQVRKFGRRSGRTGVRALALSPTYTGFSGFYQSHPNWAINGGVAGEFPANGSGPVSYVFAWVTHRSVVWISVSGGSPAQAQEIARRAGPT